MAKKTRFRQYLPVFIRDNWTCQYCGKDLIASGDALLQATVDHVVAQSLGGSGQHEKLGHIVCGMQSDERRFPYVKHT